MIVKKATKAQVRKAKELDNFQFLDVHRWSASLGLRITNGNCSQEA